MRKVVTESLSFRPEQTLHVTAPVSRPNIEVKIRTSRGKKKDLEEVRRLILARVGRQGAICYERTRKGAEETAQSLGFGARAYHADMTTEEREEVARAFACGDSSVVVATVAFGMGIDRGDVRLVALMEPPSSVEAFWQQVGRAGRDGKEALSITFVSTSSLLQCERRTVLEPISPALTAEQGRQVAERRLASARKFESLCGARNCIQKQLSEWYSPGCREPECASCSVCTGDEQSSEWVEAGARVLWEALSPGEGPVLLGEVKRRCTSGRIRPECLDALIIAGVAQGVLGIRRVHREERPSYSLLSRSCRTFDPTEFAGAAFLAPAGPPAKRRRVGC